MSWRWLGSLRLAVILLVILALACAVATLCESRFVADAYVYRNPLLIPGLFLLCLNLACSAWARWPWERRHLGFVITHGGIIILLAGAVIGHFFGFEASVSLEKGAPPTGRFFADEMVVMMQGAESGRFYQSPIRRRVLPVPESELKLQILGEGEQGIQARLVGVGGEAGRPGWIAAGTSRLLEIGRTALRVGFGPRQIPVPFGVALDDFAVPRDEGTDRPANFISDLTFTGADGEVRHARAEMNHPASFPGGWWRLLTGLNYKFSQAGWDPEDLGRTTLQVLYDPGWLFKWSGSLLICGGVALMFYFRPAGEQGMTG
jgi:hypothetical protein